jgi:hypothetical protein
MIPGHCFPVIRLPSGQLIAVEATVISDGVPFDKAVQVGMKELNESIQKGVIYLVDVQKLRALGVPTPELPSLPPSTLNDWGIRVPNAQQAQVQSPPQQGQPRPPAVDTGGGMRQVGPPNGAFTISVPANWQVQPQSQGGVETVAAMDPGTGAGAVCAVAPKQVQSLEEFVQFMLSQWQQQVPGWQTVGQQNVTISGKPAIHVRATGRPNNTPTVADYIFVLSRNNQFLLNMYCPQQIEQQMQGIFTQIAGTWRIP